MANLLAAAWGFAESTLFFIVPDVWLSYLALRSARAALIGCVFTTAGALAGGALMYGWAARDQAAALEAIDRVPAVSPRMIDRVGSDLDGQGLVALFTGPLGARPYKIYAVQAPGAGIGIVPLLLVSVLSRASRFVLVSLLAAWISRRWLAEWPRRRKLWLLSGFWIAFYVFFLTMMPG